MDGNTDECFKDKLVEFNSKSVGKLDGNIDGNTERSPDGIWVGFTESRFVVGKTIGLSVGWLVGNLDSSEFGTVVGCLDVIKNG